MALGCASSIRVADQDPLDLDPLDLDLNKSEKLDPEFPDTHLSQNKKLLRLKIGLGRAQWKPGGSKGSIDQWSQIPITLKRSKIRINLKS
jgi:hypothetical protein